MVLPRSAVPLPVGSPRPSGRISMSIAFSSSAVGGRPTPSWSASGARDAKSVALQTATKIALRRIAVRHRTVRGDFPAVNRVVVIVRVHSSYGGQRRARRLHVAGLLGAARLKDRVGPV